MMESNFTDLSSFLVVKDTISKLEDELETLHSFSQKGYSFQIQDVINSTLATLGDCCEKARLCYELLSQLHVLETYCEHKQQRKVRAILREHDSVEKLFKESKLGLNIFQDEFKKCQGYIKKIIDEFVDNENLLCDKCEGSGYFIKTKYVRERGSAPQPYTENISCKRCGGEGRIFLDVGIREELADFVKSVTQINIKFRTCGKTFENYLSGYQIPDLEGYDEIISIFPDDDPNSKRVQSLLSDFG